MEIEFLRVFNSFMLVIGPLWIIGPLMRKGLHHWILLLAIFFLLAATHYYVYVTRFTDESALLRAFAISGVAMIAGLIWAVFVSRYEARQRQSPATRGQQ